MNFDIVWLFLENVAGALWRQEHSLASDSIVIYQSKPIAAAEELEWVTFHRRSAGHTAMRCRRDEQGYLRILSHDQQTICWILWVHGNVGCAGLEDCEDANEELCATEAIFQPPSLL